MSGIKFLVRLFVLAVLQRNCLTAGQKCFAENKFGNCVDLKQCPHVLNEIQRAGGLDSTFAINRLRALSCGDTTHRTVCCLPPSYMDILNSRPPITRSPANQRNVDINDKILQNVNAYNKNTHRPKYNTVHQPGNTNFGSGIVDGSFPDIQNHPNLKLLPSSCGVIDTRDRIIGGQEALLLEMPWMALLLYDTGLEIAPKCAGTLINEWYVLTAAHCVTSLPSQYELLSVALGEYDMRQDPDCQIFDGEEVCAPNVQIVGIDEVIYHPGYNRLSLHDDVALIRLSEPANFSLENTKPICLPVTPQLQRQSLVGLNVDVAGWGITENGLQSPVLLTVSVPVVSKEDCQKSFMGQAEIRDQQLCAGGVKGKDSCGGDSGGPLTFPGRLGRGSAKHIQRGIVSFGNTNCGSDGVPGVYTNVAYYMDWILDYMHE